MNDIEIHETAFVTSIFRSKNEILSGDTFAKFWRSLKAEKWVEGYLKEVSTEETATHCLRNRYFLDTVTRLVLQEKIEVLINFGCGFSMYPFILDESLIHIEIDKPQLITHKKSRLAAWQRANLLPKRNLHFIGVDFSMDYIRKLEKKINSIKNNKSSFILIEGVLFFLSREETNTLFTFFDTIQGKGDYIGSASYQETMKETTAFKKLLRFFGQKVAKMNESEFQTIADAFYLEKTNYKVIDRQDYFSLSNRYSHKIQLDKTLILNENFYLLEKI